MKYGHKIKIQNNNGELSGIEIDGMRLKGVENYKLSNSYDPITNSRRTTLEIKFGSIESLEFVGN
ncbi:MAG: hypothetical protein LBV03_07375 [Fusobacteriales bacterium]|jgi:hypothetical protein|nr:hypothetical protein [Fusobacteriales bacterium]